MSETISNSPHSQGEGETVAWLRVENLLYTLAQIDRQRGRGSNMVNRFMVQVSWDPRLATDEEGEALIADLHKLLNRQPAEGGDGLLEVGLYVASRASVLERGQMWRDLRTKGAPIISTWIDEDGQNDTADLDELWVRIRHEVTNASGLILYVEPDDFPLKGAFVEVGMALAANVPITIVAPGVEITGRNQRPFGSWIKHPLVSFADTVEAAIAKASRPSTDAGGEQ